MHVLFVCTGNLCRSPLAERLATLYSSQWSIDDFAATSAGTRASIGQPMNPTAAAILHKLGGDSSNFAARRLNRKIALDADLIITMERVHRDTVLELAPRLLRKTFTLSEVHELYVQFGAKRVNELADARPLLAAKDAPDIPDPIGMSVTQHEAVGSQIAAYLSQVFPLLIEK